MQVYNINPCKVYSSNSKSNNNNFKDFKDKKSDKTEVRKFINAGYLTYPFQFGIPFTGLDNLGKKRHFQQIELKELSDSEFKELRSKLDKKLKNYDIDVELNKDNILLADKIFSEKRLYGNDDFNDEIEYILSDKDASSSLYKARYYIIDKVINNKKFFQNKNFVSCYLGEILSDDSLDLDSAKAKGILIDKIAASPVFSNKDMMDTEAGELLTYVEDINVAKIQSKVIDKIQSNPKLLENEIFMDKVSSIIHCTDSKNKLAFVDKILTNPNLYNNDKFLDFAGSIISEINSNSSYILADKMFSNKEFSSNNDLLTFADDIIRSLKNRSQLSVKCELIDKIVSDKHLLNSGLIQDRLGKIIKNVDNKSQYALFQKIMSDRKLYDNSNVKCLIDEIFQGVEKSSDVYIKSKVIDKILSTPQIYSNSGVQFRLGSIISSVKTLENAKVKCDLIDKITSDEKFYNNSNIASDLSPIIQNAQNPYHNKLLNIIWANENLYNNSKLMLRLPYLLLNLEKKEGFTLAKRVLTDEKLYTNENVIKYLSNIISCNNKSEFETKMAVMSIFDSLPELSSLKKIESNLGLIIDIVTPENFDFFKSLVQDKDILDSLQKEELEVEDDYSFFTGIISNCEANGTLEDYQKTKQYANLGIRLKDQLKSNDEDIANANIYGTFFSYYRELLQTEELCGKDTILAAFPLKLEGFEEFLGKISEVYKMLSDEDKQLIITKFNPENNPRIAELEKEISELKKQFEKVNEISNKDLDELKQKINEKTHEIRQLRHSKVNMSPQTKVNRLLALSALSDFGVDNLADYIDLIKDETPENNLAWNKAIEKTIFKNFNLEYDDDLSRRLNLVSSKHLDKILRADGDFLEDFSELFKLLKENPTKSITEILNDLPQNKETRRQFEEMGLDYDKWVNVDKNSYVSLNVKLKTQEIKQAAIKNLESDFNDITYKKLPKAQKQKLTNILNSKGVTLIPKKEILYDDGVYNGEKETLRLYEGDTPISFKTLSKVVSALKDEMNSDDFWTKEHGDEQIDNAVKTFYNHITKLRNADIKRAEGVKSDNEVKLEIRKTNMNDISHSLFLGNHACCCTAVGTGCNQYSAVSYIMNKAISAIEVVAGDNFVGNSMCYIAEVDGAPSLVLDNIEMNTKYQYNDTIRDAFIEYAKKLTEEIGAPDMPIYAGPERHKFNMDIYPLEEHSVKIKGATGEIGVYIDYITDEYKIDNKRIDKVSLFKIR